MLKNSLRQRLSIYADLRRHRSLAVNRSLFYNKNLAAKIGIFIAASFIVFYLAFIAVTMALAVGTKANPIHSLSAIVPFLLIGDFLFRFIRQQTPAQMIKPYILLPIPKNTLVESFLLSLMFSWNELIWQCLVTPYSIMCIFPRKGFIYGIAAILLFQLLIMVINQFYLFCRTRINDSLLWWILPVIVFGSWFLPSFTGENTSLDHSINSFITIGDYFFKGNYIPVAWTAVIIILAILIIINRNDQINHIMKELSSQSITRISNKNMFNWLGNLGTIGEYMKLETKLLLRNKNPRKMLIFAFAYVIIFGLLFSTNMKGSNTTSDIMCFCCFIMMGSNFATRIMSYEGNYIDFIMIHKENIFYLLLAKYYTYVAILAIPLCIAIVNIITGSWSLLGVLAYLLYTAGPFNLILLHAAIVNDQTIPLDAKLTTHTSNDFNYMILFISFLAMAIPFLIILPIRAFASEITGYIAIIVMSIITIAFHRIIIKNIYNIMMKRKYSHMDNFRASR